MMLSSMKPTLKTSIYPSRREPKLRVSIRRARTLLQFTIEMSDDFRSHWHDCECSDLDWLLFSTFSADIESTITYGASDKHYPTLTI